MRGGERIERAANLNDHWENDTVAVGIGCSVAIDRVLTAAGIQPKHIERGCQLAVYKTARSTRPVGPFSPNLHVSARILKKADADRAVAVTTAYPALHGGPIHIGPPEAIGVEDIHAPLLGAGLAPDPDEVCMFWGCGVTLRTALEEQPTLPWMANAEGSLIPTPLTPSAFRMSLPAAAT
jgi:uncharacterized protein YcsI (UPF0317 family)